MQKTYKIQMSSDNMLPCEQRTYTTLEAARAAIRSANGGKLHGSFIPEGHAIEGWNLGSNEGCNTAVIVTESKQQMSSVSEVL